MFVSILGLWEDVDHDTSDSVKSLECFNEIQFPKNNKIVIPTEILLFFFVIGSRALAFSVEALYLLFCKWTNSKI